MSNSDNSPQNLGLPSSPLFKGEGRERGARERATYGETLPDSRATHHRRMRERERARRLQGGERSESCEREWRIMRSERGKKEDAIRGERGYHGWDRSNRSRGERRSHHGEEETSPDVVTKLTDAWSRCHCLSSLAPPLWIGNPSRRLFFFSKVTPKP